MPKGRLFVTTRDELLECAALVRAVRAGGGTGPDLDGLGNVTEARVLAAIKNGGIEILGPPPFAQP